MGKKDDFAANLAKQQQKWEKKKEKMEKKSQTERGSYRKEVKVAKKIEKEEVATTPKERKMLKSIDNKIFYSKVAAATVLFGFYAVLMWFLMAGRSTHNRMDEDKQSPDLALQAGLTVMLLISITYLSSMGSEWRQRLIKEAEQREAACQIQGQLDRKQSEKEREEAVKERRRQQQEEYKERIQRRTKEESDALKQAKELARALRLQREKREAEEAKARAAAAKQDDGPRDEHGWTGKQRQKLFEAAKLYPEGWTSAQKKRWDMIAEEVGGHDARACREAHARLSQARAAAIASQAETQSSANRTNSAGADDLFNDLDWMEGDGDQETTTVGEDEEDEEDEDDEEDDGSQMKRMAVEVDPEHKGTEIRLDGIKTMQGCATVQVELLHVLLSCADCRTPTQLYLSGADEDAADARTWCEGCNGIISVRLRPTLLHESSNRLCYVDCVRCVVTDVLPSVLMSVCGSCDEPNVHKQEFKRNRVIDGTCFKCHAKYAFGAESIRIEQVTPCDPGSRAGSSGGQKKSSSDDPMDEIEEELRYLRKKAKSDPRQQLIRLGSALPQMGACSHFKKSFKWYRFSCCGRAFPCPQCHVDSGCPAAALGAHASRMICGKCSMEQAYSPARPCEKCGFSMMARGSSHWDDGVGTRNLATMCTKDAKKYKGGIRQANSQAKTHSAKKDRVGTKAKAKREHERKFGKDG